MHRRDRTREAGGGLGAPGWKCLPHGSAPALGGSGFAGCVPCPVHEAHELLSGRWTLAIAFALLDGPCTFGELRRRVFPISANVLSQRLGSMIERRIVTRVGGGKPGYSLTDWGRGLRDVREAFESWARTRAGGVPSSTELVDPDSDWTSAAKASRIKTARLAGGPT